MNKRGDFNYAGLIVICAIGLIVALSLMPTLGQYVGLMTSTETITNQSVTTAANGAYVDLTGQELIGTMNVNNHTFATTAGTVERVGGAATSDINVSAIEGVSSVTGYKRIRLYTNNATWASKKVNVTYTYGNEGYIDDSAGRSIAGLILVFCALLIMVTAIFPVFRNGFLEMINLR